MAVAALSGFVGGARCVAVVQLQRCWTFLCGISLTCGLRGVNYIRSKYINRVDDLSTKSQRFVGRAITKARFLLGKPASWGSLIAVGMTVLAFLIVTISPAMRAANGDWLSWGDWKKAMASGWIGLLGAAYLKASEKFKRAILWSTSQRRRRIRRKVTTTNGLRKLRTQLLPGEMEADKVKEIRAAILAGAAMSVETMLSSDNHAVVASLLDFSCDDDNKMVVVARSSMERPDGKLHDREGLVAWRAIKHGRFEVVDDISVDPRFERPQVRNYRTIAAVPVTADGKAYGAISLDCEVPYAFYGKAADIAIQLEPYAAVLALTYRVEDAHHECAYDASGT